MVSLDPRTQPQWKITGTKRFSLWPSVDAHTGRKRCHFIIRDGKTVWAHDKDK